MIALLLVAAVAAFPFERRCSLCLAAAMFLCGAGLAQIQAYHYPSHHISAFTLDEPRLARVELLIQHPPRLIADPPEHHNPLPPRQIVAARVLRVMTWDGWADAEGEILLTIYQPHPRLANGQRIQALGMLQRPAPAMNPGQFDSRRHYRNRRILTTLHVSHLENVTLLADPPLAPLAQCRQSVRRLLAYGFTAGQSRDHALLRAILVGDRLPEMRDVQEQFRRTGTGHFLAISGLHVGILGLFVYGGCRLLCLSPRKSAWLLILFLILYGLIAVPAPPVVRAVLLGTCFGLGILQRRSTSPVNLLAICILAMLIYHPLDLYSAGFQLSFGVVLGLMVFSRPTLELIGSGQDQDADPVSPDMLRGAAAIWRNIRRWCLNLLCTAAVAWAVSLPLIALHFERLNPWTIPASVLLAPIIMLALAAGWLKILLTLLIPSLAGWWAAMASWPVMLMRGMVDWLDRLPLADLPISQPPLPVVMGYYLLLCLAILAPGLGRVRAMVRLAPAAACLLMVALPLMLGLAPRNGAQGELRLTLLSVGAGQCAVVRLPDGRAILFDAGSMSLSNMLRTTVAPYLRHAGLRQIDSIHLSHPHYDHFSAAVDIVASYRVRQVWVGPHFDTNASDNPAAESLLRELRQLERVPSILGKRERIDLGPQTYLEVLWPPAGRWFDADNASVLLRLTHAGRSILVPGDIREAAMRELLRDPEHLRADILIAPHHGSAEPSTSDFLAAVDPRIILASNARRLTMKQHDFDLVATGRPLYRTSRCGAITLTIQSDGRVEVEPFLDRAVPAAMAIEP